MRVCCEMSLRNLENGIQTMKGVIRSRTLKMSLGAYRTQKMMLKMKMNQVKYKSRWT